MACEELQAASPRPQIAKAKVRSNFMSTFRCSGDARRLAVFQKTSFPGFLGAQLGVGLSISAVCGAPTTDVSILSARSRRPLLAAARTARVVPHRALPDLLRMKHSAPILDTTSIATRAPTCRLRPGASRPGRSGRWFRGRRRLTCFPAANDAIKDLRRPDGVHWPPWASRAANATVA